jgi:hypothetical protein
MRLEDKVALVTGAASAPATTVTVYRIAQLAYTRCARRSVCYGISRSEMRRDRSDRRPSLKGSRGVGPAMPLLSEDTEPRLA